MADAITVSTKTIVSRCVSRPPRARTAPVRSRSDGACTGLRQPRMKISAESAVALPNVMLVRRGRLSLHTGRRPHVARRSGAARTPHVRPAPSGRTRSIRSRGCRRARPRRLGAAPRPDPRSPRAPGRGRPGRRGAGPVGGLLRKNESFPSGAVGGARLARRSRLAPGEILGLMVRRHASRCVVARTISLFG